MPGPARDTVAGRIYNDLRNLARRTGAPTDQVMLEYVLERFLYRLAASTHSASSTSSSRAGSCSPSSARAASPATSTSSAGRSQATSKRSSAASPQIAATAIDDGVELRALTPSPPCPSAKTTNTTAYAWP